MSASTPFIDVAKHLELAGLVWQPEIGDEVARRAELDAISILVDPHGMSPRELRQTFLWLPTVEQMVIQVESRQGILFHVGLELTPSSMCYKTVLRSQFGSIEASAHSMRLAVGLALRDLLVATHTDVVN